MQIDLYKLLDENVILLVFLVLGIGFLLGNIRIGSMKIGSTIGVLLTGLVFGHFGFQLAPLVGSFGFALFIFSVGLQAGPSFFSVLLEDGPKYLALSVLVALLGLGTAVLLSALLGLEVGLGAGMMAGALTSTPSLAGAQDAFASGLGNLNSSGVTVEQAIRNVNIGYAITYIGGTVGLILFVRYFPPLVGVDLRKEARNLAKERGLLGRRRPGNAGMDNALPIIRAYRASVNSIGKTVQQRSLELGRAGSPLRVKRGDRFIDPGPDLVLEEGDIVSIVARLGVHKELQERIGTEVLDPTLLNYQITSKEIVVLKDEAVGRALKEQELIERYGCFATGLTRAGIDLPISGYLTLNKGDRLQVTGEETRLHQLAADLGYVEEEVEETDLVTFSFGIAVGVLFGLIVVKLGGISTALLFGSVTGAMTSTPALNILTDTAKSAVPALGYAGTYTIANVLLTFAGTAMAML